MKYTFAKLTLLISALGFTATNAHAWSTETSCKQKNGPVSVYVYDTHSGLKAHVFENRRKIANQKVEDSYITDGSGYSEQTRVIYKGGSVLDGGLNLRVIIDKPEAQDLVGTAHLTIRRQGRVSNILLQCDRHP